MSEEWALSEYGLAGRLHPEMNRTETSPIDRHATPASDLAVPCPVFRVTPAVAAAAAREARGTVGPGRPVRCHATSPVRGRHSRNG